MPSWDAPQLNDKQLILAQLLALGKDADDVAKIVGVPVEYVRMMKKSSLFLTKVQDERAKYIDAQRAAAREKIVKAVNEDVVDKVIWLAKNSEDEKVRLAASIELLKQAELQEKKMKVTETREVRVNLTPAQAKLTEAIIAEDVEVKDE